MLALLSNLYNEFLSHYLHECYLQIISVFAFLVADEGEVLNSYKVMVSEVKQLLEDGLEDKTLANLKDRLGAVQPQHLVRIIFLLGQLQSLFCTLQRSTFGLAFLTHESKFFLERHPHEVSTFANSSFACINLFLGIIP